MADEVITVLQHIPDAAIQPIHRALLQEMGFGFEGLDPVYIYGEDPSLYISDDFFVGLDEFSAALPLVIEAKKRAEDAFWIDVLQDILKSPAMVELHHIDVMASYTSGKARPGEHGSWAARISREIAQTMNTSDAFIEWDAEPQRIKDIEMLCDLAIRTAATTSEREAAARLGDYISNHPLVEYAEDDANGNAGKSGSD